MRLALFEKDGTRRPFEFDPAAHPWSRQAAGAAHLIGLETGLPGELAKVFVKRWEKTPAPGQALLMQTITKPLPNTPRALGVSTDSTDYYYCFPDISKSHRLLDRLMRNPNSVPKAVLQYNLGLLVCKSAAIFLEAVNERGYVYPDFTHKNVMIGGMTDCAFIDVDSCFRIDDLVANASNARGFAMTYWGVWREVVGVRSPAMLSRTMVLSFAVVWARAAAALRRGADIAEVQKMILNPTFDVVQAPFWRAIKGRDTAAFAAYFGVRESAHTKSLLGEWTLLLARLESGQPVAWPEILGIVETTLKFGGAGQPAAQPTRPATARNPGVPPPPPVQAAKPSSSSLQAQRPATPRPTTKPPPAPTGEGIWGLVTTGTVVVLVAAGLYWLSTRLPPATTSASSDLAVDTSVDADSSAPLRPPRRRKKHTPRPATDLAVAPRSTGPGFNCDAVTSDTLRIVCGDAELSAMDRALAARYKDLKINPGVDGSMLYRSEVAWIRERNACPDRACIATLYQRRLTELDAIRASAAGSPDGPDTAPARAAAGTAAGLSPKSDRLSSTDQKQEIVMFQWLGSPPK